MTGLSTVRLLLWVAGLFDSFSGGMHSCDGAVMVLQPTSNCISAKAHLRRGLQYQAMAKDEVFEGLQSSRGLRTSSKAVAVNRSILRDHVLCVVDGVLCKVYQSRWPDSGETLTASMPSLLRVQLTLLQLTTLPVCFPTVLRGSAVATQWACPLAMECSATCQSVSNSQRLLGLQ
jgi:hypothetical protein